ncbi:unnamed protein product [Closterium sp. NIES-53]
MFMGPPPNPPSPMAAHFTAAAASRADGVKLAPMRGPRAFRECVGYVRRACDSSTLRDSACGPCHADPAVLSPCRCSFRWMPPPLVALCCFVAPRPCLHRRHAALAPARRVSHRLPDAQHPGPPGQPTAFPPRPTHLAPACYPTRPPVSPAVAAEIAPAVWGEGVELGVVVVSGGDGGGCRRGSRHFCCSCNWAGERDSVEPAAAPPPLSLTAACATMGGRVRRWWKSARHLQLLPAATVAPPTAAPASTCCFFYFLSGAVSWQVLPLSLAVPPPLPPHSPAL